VYYRSAANAAADLCRTGSASDSEHMRARPGQVRKLFAASAVASILATACGSDHRAQPTQPEPKETLATVDSSFVAEFQVVGSKSGLGFGVFDRRSGAVVGRLDLTDTGPGGFGGMSAGPGGQLLVAVSDLGATVGTKNGGSTKCHGDLYRLNRLTGQVSLELEQSRVTLSHPVAGPNPGDYAVGRANCADTSHRLLISAFGHPSLVPTSLVGSYPVALDWSARGLLVAGTPEPGPASTAVQRLIVNKTGIASLAPLSLSARPGCHIEDARFDRLGVLEDERCPHGAWIDQLRKTGPTVLWRQRQPLCDGSFDTDSTGRFALFDGTSAAHCDDDSSYFSVLVGRIHASGLSLAEVPISRRFVQSATF
jgi:hypothetical protein